MLELFKNSFSICLIDLRECVELREAIVILVGWLGLLILIIFRTLSLKLFFILKVEWIGLLDPLEGREVGINSSLICGHLGLTLREGKLRKLVEGRLE